MVNPLEKVLQMLGALEAKVIKEGEEAQKAYNEFSEWCEDRSRNLGFEIKDGKNEVAEESATIGSATSTISALSAKVEELAASITTDNADLAAATKIREQESVTFKATEADLMEAVDTLRRAIMILEREMKKGSAAFLEFKKAGNNYIQALTVMLDASMIGSQDVAKLTALIQNENAADDDDDGFGAPAAAKYENHSGGIIETLEDLLDRAKDSLDSTREKESNNKHNFQMLKQSLDDEIKYSEKDMAETKKALSEAQNTKATAQGDLSVASSQLKGDEETLSTLHSDCLEKSRDFEAETRSRGDELKALATAKKVIKDTSSGAGTLSYGLNQQDDDADDDEDDLNVSFLQVEDEGKVLIKSGSDLANFEAVRLVRDLARRMHSSSLLHLAQRMSNVIQHTKAGTKDPFRKVKKTHQKHD
jgi:hypothetical protein